MRSSWLQLVLEEGLNINSLPETLKEDFNQLDRLEGEYKVTGFLTEDLEDLSPGEGSPPCGFCNSKDVARYLTELVDYYKPTITLFKVILSDWSQLMGSRIDDVYKVNVGSALYKKGIRWTEYMESIWRVFGGKHDERYMVLAQLHPHHLYDHP